MNKWLLRISLNYTRLSLKIADLYVVLTLLCKFVCLTRGVIGSRDERRKGKKSARSHEEICLYIIAIKVTNFALLDHGGKVVLRWPRYINISIYIYSNFLANREEKFALWDPSAFKYLSKCGSTNVLQLLFRRSPSVL